MTGNKEPLPKQEPRPKGRVQRSKSLPWAGPASFELPQQAMPSFEEQDKETPIEVLGIFLISYLERFSSGNSWD